MKESAAFIAGRPTRSPGQQLVLKMPELPYGFQESIFKGQVKEGAHKVCDQLVYNSLWLMMRCQGRVAGVNIQSLGSSGPGASMGGFASVKQLRKYYLGTSERRYSREYRKGVCPRKAP